MTRTPAACPLALAAVGSLLLSATPASAHQVGLSRGDYALAGGVVTAEVIFARGELATIAPAIDADGDGRVTPAELAAAKAIVERTVVARVVVESGGAPCPGVLDDARLVEEDGVLVRAIYRCSSKAPRAELRLAVLEDLPHGHRHIARAKLATGELEEVLFRGRATFELPETASPASPKGGGNSGVDTSAANGGAWSRGAQAMGTSWAHLLFLLGLILVGGSRRALATTLLAFTGAHAAGFAISVLGVWAPAARVVAPALALSVAYVGVEDLFARFHDGAASGPKPQADPNTRWRIAVPFGLVHGFALANAFAAHASPAPEARLRAVFSFHLGADVAEAAAVAAMVLVVHWCTTAGFLRAPARRALSLAIALAGLVGFALNAFGR